MTAPAVLIVPGLRDHVAAHWQTLLAERLPALGIRARTVPPMGREDLDCETRIKAIEREARAVAGPLILVAHSAGVAMVAHWAYRTRRTVHGALLAAPADLERPMPAGYPTLDALHVAGWLPVPRRPLPFPSIVAASDNDPLASLQRVTELAQAWGSRFVRLGPVGHLNPASGFGEWPRAIELIGELTIGVVHA
jgi:predicted alpha/beta hydrolase family esterase